MPYMTHGKRDYTKQGKFDAKPENIQKRADNVKQNRALEKAGIGRKGDGLDAGHKVAQSKGGKPTLGNTVLQKPSENRSFARNKDGSMKNETSKKERK
jgi:hypothetical protein